MCNKAVAIVISDLNNCRVKNSWNESNIRSLVCYTNIDVNNNEQLLEIIPTVNSCIIHNCELSKDIEKLGNKLLSIIIGSSKYKNELESEIYSHIKYINDNLMEAEGIYKNYELQYKTDKFMDYFKNNYCTLIPSIIKLYYSNTNALNSLAYTIDGINKIDHNNYE